jgi:hypothetical protein
MAKISSRRLRASAGLVLALALTALPSACATLGDPGPAICKTPDGSMVPLRDPKCPEDIRRAMEPDSGPPAPSIDQSMNNDSYNMEHGLIAGDAGYRAP